MGIASISLHRQQSPQVLLRYPRAGH